MAAAAAALLAGCAPEATAACLAYVVAADACLAAMADAEDLGIDALDPDRLCADASADTPRAWRCRAAAYDAAACADADEIPALHAAAAACAAR